jgi:hypothetical protein
VQNHQKVLNFIKKISPAAWRHIHFQGHFIFAADGSVIDLDEVIRDLVVANQDEESLIRDGLKLLTAAP